MKYLFVDCEAANSFNKISKICSLGYVLCDAKLNIIKKEDLVINPEDCFDRHLFDKKYDVNLYYPKSFFYKNPNFLKRYDEIKELFTGNTIVVGFSIRNDIKYLMDACERYKLEMFDFKYLDVQEIHKSYKGHNHVLGLDDAIKDLDIDVSNVICHKSDDDAYMTYLIFKKIFEEINLPINDFLDKYKYKTYKGFIEEKRLKEEIKEQRKLMYIKRREKVLKLYELYGKSLDKGKLLGKKYSFSKRVSKYIDEALEIQKYIYDNGGITYKDYEEGQTVIIDKDEDSAPYENENIPYIRYNQVK
ncbi:MAG: exonuclease domain-containing protein [Anaeroplasmataceae bacterium]